MSVTEAMQALVCWPFLVMAVTGLALWRPNR